MTATKRDIPTGLTFQDMLLRLSEFWAGQGCVLALPYDLEVGAGTMCPETFLRVLGPDPYRVAYPQPSRRPADGRYGENPNRLLKHTQMQVVLKPPPADIQDIYLQSLGELGINLREHDIRFEEDNWEAPTLGAWGVGWQVMLDGLEITQFTYFQQCGGIDLEPISVELTYGLERIAAFLQNVQDVYEVRWNNSLTYGDLRRAEELELSVYDFEMADAENCRKVFDLHEAEALRLLDDYRKSQKSGVRAGPLAPGQESVSKSQEPMPNCEDVIPAREHVIPAKAGIQKEGWIPAFAGMTADGKRTTDYGRRFPLRKVYELCLKCSHLFNILDARGAISVTERVALIARIRKVACEVARIYVGRMSPITEASSL